MNELVKKYPWLVVKDEYAEPDEEPITFLDWLPKGWVTTFGEILCEEIDAAIKDAGIEKDFQVDEAKEKYGALVIYFNNSCDELNAIERKFRAISETVCCDCGEIHGVKMVTRGWVSPYCRKCYGKTNRKPDYAYFDNLPTEELPTVVKWRRFSQNGIEEFEEDISETANKIKENWKNRGNK